MLFRRAFYARLTGQTLLGVYVLQYEPDPKPGWPELIGKIENSHTMPIPLIAMVVRYGRILSAIEDLHLKWMK